MRYLRRFNEELKPQTYRSASNTLDSWGHPTRASKLRDWSDIVQNKQELFLEGLSTDDLDIVLHQFIEFSDMEYHTFQIRGAEGKRYKSGFGVDGKITKSGNIVINVKCAYHCYWGVKNDIEKEVKPRLLDLGYKINQIKVMDTGKTYAVDVPVSGHDYTYRVYDPIKMISVIIKKL